MTDALLNNLATDSLNAGVANKVLVWFYWRILIKIFLNLKTSPFVLLNILWFACVLHEFYCWKYCIINWKAYWYTECIRNRPNSSDDLAQTIPRITLVFTIQGEGDVELFRPKRHRRLLSKFPCEGELERAIAHNRPERHWRLLSKFPCEGELERAMGHSRPERHRRLLPKFPCEGEFERAITQNNLENHLDC